MKGSDSCIRAESGPILESKNSRDLSSRDFISVNQRTQVISELIYKLQKTCVNVTVEHNIDDKQFQDTSIHKSWVW